MGLTLAGEVPDPAALPETALFLPRLPFVTLELPGSRGLADRIADALTDGPEPLARPSSSSATARAPSDVIRPTPSTVSSSWRCCAGRGGMRS